MDQLNDLLKGGSVESIRLAQGPIGKASVVVGLTVILFCIVAYKLTDPYLLTGLAGLVAIYVLIYLRSVFNFAAKHPGVSILEGAELVRWKELQIASNSAPATIDHTPSGPTGPSTRIKEGL